MAEQVYTLHLWPPLGPEDAPKGSQAEHYTGRAKESRLRQRWADHALGRGAKMLAAHAERGGKWVVAKVEPGGSARERQLKVQGGASRRCDVCKAVKGFTAGNLTKEEALARAGWERASEAEKSTLLDIFGIEADAAPSSVPRYEPPKPRVPRVAPEVVTRPTPEVDALVDALIKGWAQEPRAASEGELYGAQERGAQMDEAEAG